VNEHRWRTALIGFGKMAAGYASDPRQNRWFRYSTHAQVLAEHPRFDWQVAIDPAESARSQAVANWPVPHAAERIQDHPGADEIEVAVIATPPDARMDLIEAMPALRAMLVEKPLGVNLEQARRFLDACEQRNIQVAVNLPRRYDPQLQALANGGLVATWGAAQAVFGVYGNGLRNNGTHLIDLVRMLFGEVQSLSVPAGAQRFTEGPINGDCNAPFTLNMANGLTVMVQPLVFQHYREVGLDIWAEQGRLQLLNETLLEHASPRAENRQLSAAHEIAHDHQSAHTLGLSSALYAAYDNLAGALAGEVALACSGEQAFKTMQITEAVLELAVGLRDNTRAEH
jgi:predicted dehydrogenase